MGNGPFHFMGCIEIREILGQKASDEQKLLEMIEEVSINSIYFHTHSYFLRHYYIAGPYPNDFANWAAIQVRDRVLGEQLSSVIPSRDKTMEDIRGDLCDIIDHHLATMKSNPFVVYGQPFHFMTSQIIEVPTGYAASTLQEFIEALREVDASAIYNHMFEARDRVRKGRSDFAEWIEEKLGLVRLAERIEKIDAYMHTLESLRERMIELCEWELPHA